MIIIWDLTRGVVIRTIGAPGGAAAPTDIRFSSDLKSIFACSSESSIVEYSVSTGEVKQTLKGFKKGALCLAVSGHVLAAAR
jgi:WD40 repeat protein